MNPAAPFLSEILTRLGGYGSSSIGRVAVSKTVGWGFKSLLPCQPSLERSESEVPRRTPKVFGGRRNEQKCFEPWLGKPVCERRGGRVVYRGGLENRFGSTPDGGSNPSLSASPEGVRGCRAESRMAGEGGLTGIFGDSLRASTRQASEARAGRDGLSVNERKAPSYGPTGRKNL